MRVRRVLVRLLWVIGAIVLLVAGGVWVALSTEVAARKLIAVGLARSGGEVTIGRVSGRLRGPLVLTRVAVHNPAFTARVDSVLLEWSPSGLIRRQVRIDRLHVIGVRVVLPDSAPASPDTTKPERPRLPVDVVLGDVALVGLSVDGPAGARLRGGEIRLAGRAADYRINARADASLPKLEKLHLEVTAGGNLERLTRARADADLLDGRITVNGPVRWWPKIGWDLSGGPQSGRGL
jgi:autotransporter translocation and assembly factor TamB